MWQIFQRSLYIGTCWHCVLHETMYLRYSKRRIKKIGRVFFWGGGGGGKLKFTELIGNNITILFLHVWDIYYHTFRKNELYMNKIWSNPCLTNSSLSLFKNHMVEKHDWHLTITKSKFINMISLVPYSPNTQSLCPIRRTICLYQKFDTIHEYQAWH